MIEILIGRIGRWIRELHMTKDEMKQIRLVLLVALGLGIIIFITDNMPLKGSLSRNTYGKGARKETLMVGVENVFEKREIELDISEVHYTKERVEGCKDEVWGLVVESIVSGHEGLESVSGQIELPESVEGYPFSIQWDWEPRALLSVDGVVQEEQFDELGQVLTLHGVLKYRDWEYVYTQGVHLQPAVKTEEELAWQQISEFMSLADLSNIEKKDFVLPKEIDEYKIMWSKVTDYRGILITILGVICAALLLLKKKQDIEEEHKNRLQQMERDYPQIVGTFLLYLGSGMTTKNAWGTIVNDYLSKDEFRYAYEEMRKTHQEMLNGRSEIEAYEAFGSRVNILAYRKFSLLLAQNVKKGAKGMTEILDQETREAFEIRKRNAKSIGEAVGTKLLLPMFMMLGVVMIIVVVPAFLSVQI